MIETVADCELGSAEAMDAMDAFAVGVPGAADVDQQACTVKGSEPR